MSISHYLPFGSTLLVSNTFPSSLARLSLLSLSVHTSCRSAAILKGGEELVSYAVNSDLATSSWQKEATTGPCQQPSALRFQVLPADLQHTLEPIKINTVSHVNMDSPASTELKT